MRLGGARRAAAAVAACAPAEQNHDVAALRPLTANVGRRSRGNDRADLHAFGCITGVVEFIDDAGGKADLVAVGSVTCCGGLADRPLGKLAGECFAHGLQGAGRARQAHRTVDIRAAGERVADRAADAGRRAAEGFDLRGMIMRLILEEQQPRLGLSIDFDSNLHCAGVDLLGLIEFV